MNGIKNMDCAPSVRAFRKEPFKMLLAVVF